MSTETEEQYLARREQEELLLVLSASDPVARDAHRALAAHYRTLLDALIETSTPVALESNAGEVRT